MRGAGRLYFLLSRRNGLSWRGCVFGMRGELLEVFWSSFLKLSEGFTKLGYSAVTIAGMLASFYLLSQAMKTLPLGTAYAVWTGIGALGSVAVGILIFREPATAARLFFTALLLAGIIGIKLTSGH